MREQAKTPLLLIAVKNLFAFGKTRTPVFIDGLYEKLVEVQIIAIDITLRHR